MARLKTITTKTHERKIYSVSELNRRAKAVLEQSLFQVWVEAEISNLTMASSGHWYFSLKDNKAQVSCAMFRGSNARLQMRPEHGMKVLVRGKISLYEARGNYQLIVDHMETAGIGDLLVQFEQLKAKLSAEGLFDVETKRPISQHNQVIGVITSATGAALHDVLSTIGRRYPLQQVVIYPSLVQGKQAAENIINQIIVANERSECDVLLLVRGGGSMEDLWSFNDEDLAREIANSVIPIVSGVGHEVDVTIADMVADLRAATPTAAAEKTTPDQREILQQIHASRDWITKRISDYLQRYGQQLDWYQRQLKSPETVIDKHKQRLSLSREKLARSYQNKLQELSQILNKQRLSLLHYEPRSQIQSAIARTQRNKQKLWHSMQNQLLAKNHRLAKLSSQLDALSPLKVLGRGYSVTTDESGKVLDNAEHVKPGKMIISRLRQGQLVSEVKKIIK